MKLLYNNPFIFLPPLKMERIELIKSIQEEIKIAKELHKENEQLYDEDQEPFNVDSSCDLFEYWFLRGLETALTHIKD